jgi:transcriptional regulator with XRE-family HTH domain
MLNAMLGSQHQGRRKGIAVREGSVAQARKEAGLTLAQIADGKLSRTAIHLIEKGVTRPSMETLSQIAHQTRKPMGFFLQIADGLSPFTERARLQTAKRNLAQALAAGEASREPSVQAKVYMLLGQVDEWCGNSRRADEQFETAIQILQELGKPEPLRDAHMAYADLLDARGDVTGAAQHWRQSADIGKLAALGLGWSASSTKRRVRADTTGGLTS